jgi:putative hydrolase of the HAD superfamily
VRAWQGRKGFGYTREDWYGVVREAFGERAGELPEGFFPAVYERFAEPDVWRVFEDVRPVLAALRERGVRMGVISNWDDRLQPLLRALELHECFDVVVVSYAAGVTKPSPAIFKAALRGLRLEAHEVLHLGDSEREDVAGARGAGLHALKVERNRAGPDLRELPGLLQRAD